MVPKLTRLIFSSIQASAAWAIEAFISLCEALVRAAIQSAILVLVAVILIDGSTWLQSRVLMIMGVVVGLVGFLRLAFASSIFRMGIEVLTSISATVKREVERLSDIMFVGVLTVFYLSLDKAYQHPILLFGFLCTLAVLYFATILPGESGLIGFFKPRFQWIVLVWAILLTGAAVIPESITNRVIYSHGLEKATGTITTEIPFRVDERNQIIDLTTNQPMELFERISSVGVPPKALKGWTMDEKGSYHLHLWFYGQGNWTQAGDEIQPITKGKIGDIIAWAKVIVKQKADDEQKLKDEQAVVAVATDAKAKTAEAANELQREADRRADDERKLKAKQAVQQAADEIAHRRQQELEALTKKRAEAERIIRDRLAAEEEQRQLDSRPISVAGTILAPTDQSKDTVVVRPSVQFTYRGSVIQPDQAVISLDITDVKPADKNKYELTLQPQMLMSGGQRYDISRQTGLIQFIVHKDSSHSILKILAGAGVGVGIGAIAGGKKGAVEGLLIGGAAGTVYAVASHGQKFQLTVGDEMPPIVIKQVP